MPVGRPPKPTEQKRAIGNPGRRPLPEPVVELAAAAHIPKPPRQLCEPGREAWDRLWTAAQAWLSPKTDLNIMTRLCESIDLRAAIAEELAATGFMVKGSMGQVRVNPLLDKLLALDAQITKFEGLCGFTPADRARLGVAEVKRASAVEDFLAKRSERTRKA
jgi:P27 family predicted phage terminase small subunit